MFNFESNSRPVISALQDIHDRAENSELNAKNFENHRAQLQVLQDFFSCTDEQAVLLSIFLHFCLENKTVSVKEVLDHTDLRFSHACAINEVLQPLVARKLISPKKDVTLYPLTEYQIPAKLMRCVIAGNWSHCEPKKIKNTFDLLSQYQTRLTERKDKRTGYEEFLASVQELVHNHPDIPLASFIQDSGMDSCESAFFMNMMLKHYHGDDNFSYLDIITDINPPKEEQYRMRTAVKNNEPYLLKSGLVRKSTGTDFFGGSQYCLSSKALRMLDSGAVAGEEFESGMFRQIQPGNIVEQVLIFEEKEARQVKNLHTMLERDNFRQLGERLSKRGMKAGISILLYGPPGTGKTETVLQLGRTCGRTILQADASKIRSKWVGESGKNIKALFDEYRKARSVLDETPILLFNEADAILSKRHQVTDRGDQEMNTVQNILLEELENFEGIFIATTNLVNNFDKAFDRRLLYKLRFEKPGKKAMLNIWKSKFPEAGTAVLRKLCEAVSLTGGQIENVRKKATVEQLLQSREKLSYSFLLELAEEEHLLENNGMEKRNSIGFLRQRDRA